MSCSDAKDLSDKARKSFPIYIDSCHAAPTKRNISKKIQTSETTKQGGEIDKAFTAKVIEDKHEEAAVQS